MSVRPSGSWHQPRPASYTQMAKSGQECWAGPGGADKRKRVGIECRCASQGDGTSHIPFPAQGGHRGVKKDQESKGQGQGGGWVCDAASRLEEDGPHLVRNPHFPKLPHTLQGCIELLERYKIPIAGKRAAVVGRSNIVGLPASMLLQNRDATVTVIHSRTPDAEKICAGGLRVWGMCGEGGFSLPPLPSCTLVHPMLRRSAQVGSECGGGVCGGLVMSH